MGSGNAFVLLYNFYVQIKSIPLYKYTPKGGKCIISVPNYLLYLGVPTKQLHG